MSKPTTPAQKTGERIRKARQAAGMRLSDLAKALAELGEKMSQPTLSRIENGTASVRVEQLQAIGRALGKDYRRFLTPAAEQPAGGEAA